MTMTWNDDRYTALTLLSLIFCYGLLVIFAPRSFHDRFGLLKIGRAARVVQPAGVVGGKGTAAAKDQA